MTSIGFARSVVSKPRFVSLPEVIRCHATRSPTSTAFVAGSRRLGWAEFDRRVDAVAAWLAHRGLRRGDRVACLVTDPLECLAALFGTARAAGVVVPLPARLEAGALHGLLEHCRPKFVLADRAPAPFGRFAAHSPVGRIVRGPQRRGSRRGRDLPSIRPRDEFSIVYTSGSTGTPQGVVHSHAARYSSALRDVRHFCLERRSTALLATPLYASMTWSVILPIMLVGGTCVLSADFSAAALADVLRVRRVTLMKLVPTQYAMLLEDPSFPRACLRRVSRLLYSGAPAGDELGAAMKRLFPFSATEVYGASECGPITYIEASAAFSGGAGTPFSGVEIRILDEHGNVVAAERSGAVAVSSPGLMLRYHRNPERTRAALWTDPTSGRPFCRVGDIGRLGRDGRLCLDGRSDDVMISGGFNVHARDIRRVLLRHEEVTEAAVLPAPQRYLGTVPVAFVVLRTGSGAACSDVCAWANARLSRYQRLQWVRRLDRLPVNAAGKLARRALGAMVQHNDGS